MSWARSLHCLGLCLCLVEEVLVQGDVLDVVCLLINKAIACRKVGFVLCTLLEEDVHCAVAIAKENGVCSPVVCHVHALRPACTASSREVGCGEARCLGQGDEVILNLATLRAAGHRSRLDDDGVLLAVSIVGFHHLHVTIAGRGNSIVPLVGGSPLAGSRVEVAVVEYIHIARGAALADKQKVAVGKFHYMCLVAIVGNLAAKHFPCGAEVVGIDHHVAAVHVNSIVDTVVLGAFCLANRLDNSATGEEGTHDAAAAVGCTDACIHECLHEGWLDVFVVAPCLAAVGRAPCNTSLLLLADVRVIDRVRPAGITAAANHQDVVAGVAGRIVCHSSRVAEAPLDDVRCVHAPVALCHTDGRTPCLAAVVTVATLDARRANAHIGVAGTVVGKGYDATALCADDGRQTIGFGHVLVVVVPKVQAVAFRSCVVSHKGSTVGH